MLPPRLSCIARGRCHAILAVVCVYASRVRLQSLISSFDYLQQHLGAARFGVEWQRTLIDQVL